MASQNQQHSRVGPWLLHVILTFSFYCLFSFFCVCCSINYLQLSFYWSQVSNQHDTIKKANWLHRRSPYVLKCQSQTFSSHVTARSQLMNWTRVIKFQRNNELTRPVSISVPPDILDAESSKDITINEGQNASLFCVASGNPHPRKST